MPRIARVVLPGYPHHVIQRGHNSAPVFVHEKDFNFYLELLKKWKTYYCCKVYAYCLMTNHVHLVVEPGEEDSSLGQMMKRVAARYTRYINRVEQRSGTVWNGRYKSSPIETERYFMACCRYVELNPMRAGIVPSLDQYPWSSFRHHSNSIADDWLDEHPLYTVLGATPEERCMRYREWIETTIPQGEMKLIRDASHQGKLTGGRRFRRMIEKRIGRRLVLRGPGRPFCSDK